MKVLNENMNCSDTIDKLLKYISDDYTLSDKCYIDNNELYLVIYIKTSTSWHNKTKTRYFLLPYIFFEQYIPATIGGIQQRYIKRSGNNKPHTLLEIIKPFNNYHRAINYEKAFNQFAYLLI